MFSLQHMQRQFTAGRFDLLLKSVMHNGLELPRELADHLLEHPVCSTALALRRAMEVSYSTPDTTTGRMVEFLLNAQEVDGSLGFAPLPTACGLAALHSVIQQAPQGSLPVIRPQALTQAHDAASGAMLAMITEESQHGLVLSSPSQTPLLTQSDAMDWAFVLLLLSDNPLLHFAPDTDRLHRWFAANERQLPQPIARIWHRTGWFPTPAPGSVSERASGITMDQPMPPRDIAPDAAVTHHKMSSHGRFHQSPHSNLRRGTHAKHPHAA